MISVHCDICLFVCLSVCLCVCFLSARMSQKPHVQISPNFLYMLPAAVARSSSDGNAICYVLPVLRMTMDNTANGKNQARRVCFVEFAKWRHRDEVCRLRLHLVFGRTRRWRLKPRPYQQQCRSNIVECYKSNDSFDKVECCFDIVAVSATMSNEISSFRQSRNILNMFNLFIYLFTVIYRSQWQ